MKRAIGDRYRLWVGAALVLDAVFVFGPPVFQPDSFNFPLMLSRWLVMIVGGYSLIWAHDAGTIGRRPRYWLSMYLIFGFTAAGALNGLGTFRL
jgi:hypothetical protein